MPNQEHVIEFTVQESGWFLLRGIAENQKTFRFVSTAPFYIEIGSSPQRISESSSRFFLDWVNKRIDRVKLNILNKSEQAKVLQYHLDARKFWNQKIQTSNSD